MDRHSEGRRTRSLSIAGGAAFLAAAQWILLVIVAETRYPGYSVAAELPQRPWRHLSSWPRGHPMCDRGYAVPYLEHHPIAARIAFPGCRGLLL